MRKFGILLIVIPFIAGWIFSSHNRSSGVTQSQSTYVGTWKAEGGMFSISMIINQDGTGTSSSSSSSRPITWKNDGDHILITEPQSGQSIPAKLSSDGSGLTMGEGNNSQVYIRQ